VSRTRVCTVTFESLPISTLIVLTGAQGLSNHPVQDAIQRCVGTAGYTYKLYFSTQ
jgi:hypothetical protein